MEIPGINILSILPKIKKRITVFCHNVQIYKYGAFPSHIFQRWTMERN